MGKCDDCAEGYINKIRKCGGTISDCECKNDGKCSACGKDISDKIKKKVVINGSIKKSESMFVAPEYIVLSLQRFKKVDQKNEEKGYLNKNYFIDIENLANVKMCIGGENVNYELCAIAVKEGQPGSGHYYAYVKLSDGKFYNFDDSNSVVEVDIKNASKTAYVLFYKKKVS